jgi:hypothetical protein
MNSERLLSLAIQAKLDPSAIDEIIHMATVEIENEVSRKTGKKNQYSAITKFIKRTKSIHKKNGRSHDSLYGVFQNNNHWCISDGFGGVRFANLDVKDLPVTEGPDLQAIITDIKKKCVNVVDLPSQSELEVSYKKQLAESKNSNDYAIYVKIGSHYYNPDELTSLLSMMDDNFVAKEMSKAGMYIVDSTGNECVVLGLNADGLNIRETE